MSWQQTGWKIIADPERASSKMPVPQRGQNQNHRRHNSYPDTRRVWFRSGSILEIEITDVDFGNEDKMQYCINVILKEAKLEDRLVKQTFYTMLSAYTSNPLNLAINSPSGEGKNYVLRKVAEKFPKEDIMFLAGMTDKALFHREENCCKEW